MSRDKILREIRSLCEKKYAKIDNWIHDVDHVKGVVRLGKQIAKKEGVDEFLVEIACWLHDLGRVGEPLGLDFKESNHAEISYLKGKKILASFVSEIGKENVKEILLAVREHSLPKFRKAGKSKIAQILRDADRGMGLRPRGIYTQLSHYQIIDYGKPGDLRDIRKKLKRTLEFLRKDERKRELAIENLKILLSWYKGKTKRGIKSTKCTTPRRQGFEGQESVKGEDFWIVGPLCTETAKRMFYEGYLEIKRYIEQLRNP